MSIYDKKLTVDEKNRVKETICNFIDQLDENDFLRLSGNTTTDIFTTEGEHTMLLSAKQYFKFDK